MKDKYDPFTPIESLYEQIENVVEIVAVVGAPYAPKQVINNTYNIIFHSSIFHNSCRDWCKKNEADRTCTDFKTHFTELHHDFRSRQHRNSYASANAAVEEILTLKEGPKLPQKIVSAPTTLATATAADRSTMATLSNTNECLSKQSIIITERLS